MIYLASDHRGFDLKEQLKKRLVDEGLEIIDLGNDHLDPNDDYVDFAQKVASAVRGGEQNKGILLCGSGVGVDMVANKMSGIRSSLVFDEIRAKQSREHEDANVLSLAADVLDSDTAWEIVKTFIETPFSKDERHIRRLEKVAALEQ